MTSEADKSGFTYMAFAGTKMKLDVAYFIIEGTPNKSGRVLVDTGTYAKSMAKYWPGKAEDVQSFEESLEKEGMTVDDVDIIIQTHLHHDHCVNTSKCKNAEVYVQEEEWAFATAPHPLQAQYYPKEIYGGWNLKLIRGDYTLFPAWKFCTLPGTRRAPNPFTSKLRTVRRLFPACAPFTKPFKTLRRFLEKGTLSESGRFFHRPSLPI